MIMALNNPKSGKPHMLIQVNLDLADVEKASRALDDIAELMHGVDCFVTAVKGRLLRTWFDAKVNQVPIKCNGLPPMRDVDRAARAILVWGWGGRKGAAFKGDKKPAKSAKKPGPLPLRQVPKGPLVCKVCRQTKQVSEMHRSRWGIGKMCRECFRARIRRAKAAQSEREPRQPQAQEPAAREPAAS